MVTITNKTFIAFNACGTDGIDDSLMKAIYNVVDSNYFSYQNVEIPKTIHDGGIDEEINQALSDAIEEEL